MRVAVAMLPALGLDGLSGIGGSILYDAGQYDSISHVHVLLENPRSGILKMIALEPGDPKPERWAPTDVASYMTVHVNFDAAVKTLAPMWDSLAGEGGFSKMIQWRFSTPMGVDFEKQILPALEGRVTYITWFEQPATLVSGVTLVAVKLKDTEAVRKAMDGLANRFGERISKQSAVGQGLLSRRSSGAARASRAQSRRRCRFPASASWTTISCLQTGPACMKKS